MREQRRCKHTNDQHPLKRAHMWMDLPSPHTITRQLHFDATIQPPVASVPSPVERLPYDRRLRHRELGSGEWYIARNRTVTRLLLYGPRRHDAEVSFHTAHIVLVGGDDLRLRLRFANFPGGSTSRARRNHLKAYLLYAEAAQIDGTNRLYAKRMAAMAQGGALQPQRTQALPDQRADSSIDPANETLAAHPETEGLFTDESLVSPAASPAPRLVLSSQKRSFQLTGTVQNVFEQVATVCQDSRPVRA